MNTKGQSDKFSPLFEQAQKNLSSQGFDFLQSEKTLALFEDRGFKNWESFAESWNHLGIDRYMADGGRYRRRRYATFSVTPTDITRKPHQPHYQSRDYNMLNGGVERWFRPITDNIAHHPVMLSAIRTIGDMADVLTPEEQKPLAWHAEVHQFRIEALPDAEGKPTPEGLHKDGVDWVLVLMVNRHNVEQGITTIHDNQKELLGSFTLAHPLDAALVNDHQVYHGVTAVTPVDSTQPAFRDVLVVTLRHA
ncbi:2OG-Fe dioxygenase family protein [Swingsia samuiensis]|uniref:2OG-Fe dioxygenase family protein n=1 Tax=Swingsia samuiensis TaxID=1293412 RepID=A0A4Y6ULS2_9PROT|nr:2OG-Fe dioxygenase family protein [Swingsia samuiensis]QDH17277.1 hypothetical protein E3D00_06680 [Swingsia samuiensis]